MSDTEHIPRAKMSGQERGFRSRLAQLIRKEALGWMELQVTCPVISCVDPSFFMPMAMNCWMAPTGMAGIGVMEDRVAEVTVRVVLPEILPEVAVMVAAPTAPAVARPVLLTVATDVLEEAQVTCGVMSWLVPSEYVPEAANC